MKYCPNCGAQNEDDFTLCGVCGALMEENKSAFSLKTDAEVQNRVDSMQESQPASNTYYAGAQGGMTQPTNAYGQQQNQMPGGAYQNNDYQGQPYNPSQALFGGSDGLGMGNSGVDVSRPPVKADKGKIYIALGVIGALLVVAMILIFSGGFFKRGGVDSPEEVARVYMQGINERDLKLLDTLIPPFAASASSDEDMQSLMDMADAFNLVYNYTITDTYYYSSSEVSQVERELQSNYGTSVNLQDVCEVYVDIEMSMSYMGESYSDSMDYTLRTIKMNGRWYVFDPME